MTTTETPSVLIIDDTTANLGVVVNALEYHGYRVLIARDGEEGLMRAGLVRPDLILLDVMMPGMDGFEVCRRLKARPETVEIPVIFMTALAGMGDKVSGFKVGGVDYVTKPFQTDELLARVGAHVALRTLQKRLEAQNAELQSYRDSLEQQVAARTRQLHQLNETLEQRVRDEVAKNREKDHQLIQQSRLAAMGEMVHNIAHQWRQPLNTIAIILGNIQDDYAYGELTKERLAEMVATGGRIVQSMSTTIDDFRHFFRPGKEQGDFSIAQCLREVESIMGAALSNHEIELVDEIDESIVAHGYDNEFSQVLLNVVNNAKDAIVSNHVCPGWIRVEAERKDNEVEVRVSDNGGGIAEDVLPKVFDPYFTTKDKGSGIGLYMSKMIIEGNMGGEISVRNIENGVEVLIRIPAANP